MLGIARQSVLLWISEGKISNNYLVKVKSRGASGFKYLMDPLGSPEPYRSKYIHEFLEANDEFVQKEQDTKAYDNAPDWAKEHVELWLTLIKKFGHLRGKELKTAINAYREAHPEDKVSFKSFYRKRKEYEESGIAGLIPNYGNRRGASKVEDVDFTRFCNQYLRQSRPSAMSCWSIVRGAAFKEGRDLSEFPAVRTFQYRLEKEFTESHIYFCRYGKEAWNKKYNNYADRDKGAIKANECWVGDHRVLDILLYDPETDKNFRPWVTAWMDFKTNKIISYELYHGNPNSDRIFQSFKWGVEEYGRPYNSVYIDNGKDYRALDFAGGTRLKVDERKTRTLMHLIGIEAHFSLPYNAQSKNIERAFKEFINYHESHLPGYTGSHQKERPEDTDIRAKKGDLLTLDVFKEQFDRFVHQVFNKKTSQGKELKGRSPDEAFFNEWKEKIAVRSQALHLMCMRSSKAVTIGRNGVKDSQIDQHYWADWMMNYKGVKVYIRRDIKKYNEAWVYSAVNDEFLGTATLLKRINGFVQTDVEKAELKAQLATRRREIKLHEEQHKLRAKQRLSQEDLIDALIANNKADEELRKKRGEFQEYDEKADTIYMDTTEMDKNIKKDEAMKRAGNEDLDELLPPPPKPPASKQIKGIFD